MFYYLFTNSLLSVNNQDKIYNQVKNVSNSYDPKTGIISCNEYMYELNNETNEIVYNGSQPKPPKPVLNQNNLNFEYNNQTTIDVYNTNLKQYKQNNSDLSLLQKSLVKRSNDILVLYDNNGVDELPVNYAKYLDTSSSFNTSLFKNVSIYRTEQEIIDAKNNLKSLEPATVTIFYDLNGNVINPGIMLDENGDLIASSAAIYDSENLIYDNLWRNTSVLRDTTKVFFEVDPKKNVYKLFDARVKFVYTVVLENKNYYFPSYDSTFKFIKDFVELHTLRVNK